MVVINGESPTYFKKVLSQFEERFHPVSEFEFNTIEEMASSYWRMRRAWALETRTLDKAIAFQPENQDPLGRITAGFHYAAANRNLGLIHRYEARLHRMYRRSLETMLMLEQQRVPPGPHSGHRPPDDASDAAFPIVGNGLEIFPNEPSPTSGQPEPPPSQPAACVPAPVPSPDPAANAAQSTPDGARVAAVQRITGPLGRIVVLLAAIAAAALFGRSLAQNSRPLVGSIGPIQRGEPASAARFPKCPDWQLRARGELASTPMAYGLAVTPVHGKIPPIADCQKDFSGKWTRIVHFHCLPRRGGLESESLGV
jgi:hypothetical protein